MSFDDLMAQMRENAQGANILADLNARNRSYPGLEVHLLTPSHSNLLGRRQNSGQRHSTSSCLTLRLKRNS